MSPWGQGRATVEQVLADGQIERVPASMESARSLIAKAQTHLRSADTRADTDVELAYDALHAANCKGLAAGLIAQGPRPTRHAGRTGAYEAVRAQLDPPLGRTFAPCLRIRRARNAGDYLDELPAKPDDVHADLPLCQAMVGAARKVLGQMPPY